MANLNKRWKESLDLLKCPYTKDIPEEEVGHLLLNENEERLEIFEWLLLLYQPRLSRILKPEAQKGRRIVKSKIERILKAATTVTLCHAEDVDLIKGVSPKSKQKHFINTLIDLVTSRESGQLINLQHASAYLDNLAEQGSFLGIEDKVTLVPKDIRAEVECLYSGKKRNHQPSLEELRTSYQECAKEVEKLEEELKGLQSKISIQTPSQQREVSAMNQMLSSSIHDLDQLASGFLHSYESHIGAWCQKPSPDLNDLGPSTKRVHTQLKKFVTYLDDVNKLRQLRCELEDNMKEKRTRQIVEGISTDSSTSDNVQRCLGILEESVHRAESGFRSRYPNLLQL